MWHYFHIKHSLSGFLFPEKNTPMTVTHLEDFLVDNNLHWVILFRFHFLYSLTLWRSDAGRFSGHWSDHPEAVLHIKHIQKFVPTFLWYVYKHMDVLMSPNMAAMTGRLVMVELVFNCHCHNKNLLYCYCFTLQHNVVWSGSVYILITVATLLSRIVFVNTVIP